MAAYASMYALNYVPEPEKIEAGVKILAEEIEEHGLKAINTLFRR